MRPSGRPAAPPPPAPRGPSTPAAPATSPPLGCCAQCRPPKPAPSPARPKLTLHSSLEHTPSPAPFAIPPSSLPMSTVNCNLPQTVVFTVRFHDHDLSVHRHDRGLVQNSPPPPPCPHTLPPRCLPASSPPPCIVTSRDPDRVVAAVRHHPRVFRV